MISKNRSFNNSSTSFSVKYREKKANLSSPYGWSKLIIIVLIVNLVQLDIVQGLRVSRRCPLGHFYTDGCVTCWCEPENGKKVCENMISCPRKKVRCPMGAKYNDECGNDCTCYENTGAVFCKEKGPCNSIQRRNTYQSKNPPHLRDFIDLDHHDREPTTAGGRLESSGSGSAGSMEFSRSHIKTPPPPPVTIPKEDLIIEPALIIRRKSFKRGNKPSKNKIHLLASDSSEEDIDHDGLHDQQQHFGGSRSPTTLLYLYQKQLKSMKDFRKYYDDYLNDHKGQNSIKDKSDGILSLSKVESSLGSEHHNVNFMSNVNLLKPQLKNHFKIASSSSKPPDFHWIFKDVHGSTTTPRPKVQIPKTYEISRRPVTSHPPMGFSTTATPQTPLNSDSDDHQNYNLIPSSSPSTLLKVNPHLPVIEVRPAPSPMPEHYSSPNPSSSTPSPILINQHHGLNPSTTYYSYSTSPASRSMSPSVMSSTSSPLLNITRERIIIHEPGFGFSSTESPPHYYSSPTPAHDVVVTHYMPVSTTIRPKINIHSLRPVSTIAPYRAKPQHRNWLSSSTAASVTRNYVSSTMASVPMSSTTRRYVTSTYPSSSTRRHVTSTFPSIVSSSSTHRSSHSSPSGSGGAPQFSTVQYPHEHHPKELNNRMFFSTSTNTPPHLLRHYTTISQLRSKGHHPPPGHYNHRPGPPPPRDRNQGPGHHRGNHDPKSSGSTIHAQLNKPIFINHLLASKKHPEIYLPPPPELRRNQYRLILKNPDRPQFYTNRRNPVPLFVDKIAHEFFRKPAIFIPNMRKDHRGQQKLELKRVAYNHREMIPSELFLSPGGPKMKIKFSPEAEREMDDEWNHAVKMNQALGAPKSIFHEPELSYPETRDKPLGYYPEHPPPPPHYPHDDKPFGYHSERSEIEHNHPPPPPHYPNDDKPFGYNSERSEIEHHHPSPPPHYPNDDKPFGYHSERSEIEHLHPTPRPHYSDTDKPFGYHSERSEIEHFHPTRPHYSEDTDKPLGYRSEPEHLHPPPPPISVQNVNHMSYPSAEQHYSVSEERHSPTQAPIYHQDSSGSYPRHDYPLPHGHSGSREYHDHSPAPPSHPTERPRYEIHHVNYQTPDSPQGHHGQISRDREHSQSPQYDYPSYPQGSPPPSEDHMGSFSSIPSHSSVEDSQPQSFPQPNVQYQEVQPNPPYISPTNPDTLIIDHNHVPISAPPPSMQPEESSYSVSPRPTFDVPTEFMDDFAHRPEDTVIIESITKSQEVSQPEPFFDILNERGNAKYSPNPYHYSTTIASPPLMSSRSPEVSHSSNGGRGGFFDILNERIHNYSPSPPKPYHYSTTMAPSTPNHRTFDDNNYSHNPYQYSTTPPVRKFDELVHEVGTPIPIRRFDGVIPPMEMEMRSTPQPHLLMHPNDDIDHEKILKELFKMDPEIKPHAMVLIREDGTAVSPMGLMSSTTPRPTSPSEDYTYIQASPSTHRPYFHGSTSSTSATTLVPKSLLLKKEPQLPKINIKGDIGLISDPDHNKGLFISTTTTTTTDAPTFEQFYLNLFNIHDNDNLHQLQVNEEQEHVKKREDKKTSKRSEKPDALLETDGVAKIFKYDKILKTFESGDNASSTTINKDNDNGNKNNGRNLDKRATTTTTTEKSKLTTKEITIKLKSNQTESILLKDDDKAATLDPNASFKRELDWKKALVGDICTESPNSPICLTYRSLALLMNT